MAELGADTLAQHRRMTALAEELGLEVHGYQTDLYGTESLPDAEAAVALLQTLSPGDAVLLKGSRVARLEDVVHAYGTAVGAQSPVAETERAETTSPPGPTRTRRASSP
jgi:UDP-N-acetylmuramoyl-tripeptide--D-alanyl-D-alanine ligase